MNEPNRFELSVEGKVLATPCLDILVSTFENLKDSASSLECTWRTFADSYGKELKYYLLNDSTRVRKVKTDSLDLIPFWTNDKAALKQADIGVEYHSGSTGDLFRVPAYKVFYDQATKKRATGVVRFTLPVEAAEEFNLLWSLVQDAFSQFPIAWGVASLGFYWRVGCYEERRITQQMAPLLKRHPGLSRGVMMTYVVNAREGVFSVGWLNFLGPEYIEKLGGRDALKKTCDDKKIEVLPLGENNLVLRAGEKPRAGDVNRGDRLDELRDVASVLMPVWAGEKASNEIWVDGMKDGDEMYRWVTRFFKDWD